VKGEEANPTKDGGENSNYNYNITHYLKLIIKFIATFDTLLMGEDNFPKELSVKITLGNPQRSLIYGGQETPALVEVENISCDNGQIHIIDNVLIPYVGSTAPTH